MIMPRGKPSPKLAITVDADVHARVLDAAAEAGVSVSAWMTDAARRALLVVPVTTAPVVAQVSRSPRQAQLRRFLRGCDVVPLVDEDAHEVGGLAGKAKVSDVVDVHVVLVADRRAFGVVTGDVDDLKPV